MNRILSAAVAALLLFSVFAAPAMADQTLGDIAYGEYVQEIQEDQYLPRLVKKSK